MVKIDRRKNYYLTIDTETANSLDDALVYDIGGAIHDKKGRVYETFSFVIYEIFVGMKDLMKTAYYAEKIPKYEDDLRAGSRKMVRYNTARKHIADLCKKYNVRAIIAHNARFDYRATNTTQRYLTCSKYRYFLPYGIEVWDTLKMVKSTVAKQKSYVRWCEENGFMVDETRPRMTAEILYKYMTNDIDYKESHTGLEDVLIEKEIFVWCMRQKKKMEKKLFA
jgi:DNA polymerase III epsilon subunit-like protein